jgi:hypothetical protein
MNETIESLYQEIGTEALDVVGGDAGSRVVVYASVADDVVRAEVYRGEHDRIVYKFSSPRLVRLIYDFWSEWRAIPGNREWRAILYRIEAGKFDIEFTYPDKFDPSQDVSERRSGLAQRFFGGLPFDYQNPKARA